MSLYKDASLVMIPSAYKDGKLYSIRPTDGSGDFTFSRGSNLAATRVDVNGLIEKGRENLITHSNEFDNTSGWTQYSGYTLTSGQADKDGGTNAWKWESTQSGTAQINNVHNQTGMITHSIYAKAGNIDVLKIWIGVTAEFNLTTGVASHSQSKMTDVGNGWWRCEVFSPYTRFNPFFSPTASGQYFYIQDAQAEKGLVATDYIETGTSAAQSGILEDMPRLDYSGGASCPSLLLEPQRSNILTQSEYLGGEFSLDNVSLDYNYGISPEGVSNSALLTQTGSSPSNSMYEFGLTTTDGSYTYSFFFKAGTSTWCRMYTATGIAEDFNPQTITAGYSGGTLNILFEDYGNGWWRASATQTLSGASTNRFSIYPDRGNQGRNVEIWGAQVEVGSYPTSYIPTYGTSQTRSNDDMDTTFSSALATNGGVSVLFDIKGTDKKSGSAANGRYLNFATNSTLTTPFIAYNRTAEEHRVRVYDGTSSTYTSTEVDIENDVKIVIVAEGDTHKVFSNGVLRFTRTTNSIDWSSITDFVQTSDDNIGVIDVKQLLMFPTALTDSECIALTS